MKRMLILAAVCCLFSSAALAAPPREKSVTVPVVMIGVGDTGSKQTIGNVTFTDTDQGLRITAAFSRLPPGEHGFHIHEFPNCGAKMENGSMVAGLAAGGHYDPKKTGRHLGPDKPDGHAGDLPRLTVGPDGTVKQTMVMKNLKLEDVRKRSIIVHAGGDNYSDTPAANGGGGARIACGVIP